MNDGSAVSGLLAACCVAALLVAAGGVGVGAVGGDVDAGGVDVGAADVDVPHVGAGDASDLEAGGTFALDAGQPATGDASLADDDTIHVENTLALTDEPGTVGVRTEARLPDRVTDLRLTLLSVDDEGVIEADGFERDGGADGAEEWVWDGETDRPSLTYATDANVTVDPEGPLAGEGSYRFVGVDEWAIIQPPRVGVTGSYVGPGRVRIERENAVDGEGVASRALAFLGPHEEHVHETADGRVRLVVPDAADPVDPPRAVFEAFEHAETALPVGARNDEVVAVTAPTGDVAWGVRGLQTGEADLWVRDEEPAGTAEDVWTHEYVHTRQRYRTEPSARWIPEATATYYAALFAVDRGAADFESFEGVLARGEREPDASAVLADPDTWDGPADYTKGALVAGEIDRKLRLLTEGEASLATVFRELNAAPEPVTNEAFLDAVADAAADGSDAESAADLRATAERLTTTRDAPETWDHDAHAAAFGETPAQVGYGFPKNGVRAAGEYRDRAVDRDPVQLVAGETLALGVVVRNTGGVAGSYALTLRVDGDAVGSRTGEIAAGAETTERFEHAFAAPGEHEVTVGGESLRVLVTDPAGLVVRDVGATPDRVAVGESVTVTATVANEEPIPGRETLSFRVNGETVATETVRLDVAEETRVERSLALNEPGDVTVSVAGSESEDSTTVTVERATGWYDDGLVGDDGETGGTDGEVPGFGPATALLAMLTVLATLAVSALRLGPYRGE